MTRTELRARVSKRAIAIAIDLRDEIVTREAAQQRLGKRFTFAPELGIWKTHVILGPGYVLKLGPEFEIDTETGRARRFARSPHIAVTVKLAHGIAAQERGRTFASLYPGLEPYSEEDMATLPKRVRDAVERARQFGRSRVGLDDDQSNNFARFKGGVWKWIDLG